MKDKKKDKKLDKTTKQLFLLAFALLLLISSSYAWLHLTIDDTKTNVLRAGSLSLTLDDTTSEGIALEKAVPVTDGKGKTGTEYTFTLQNKGKTAVDYTIYIDDIALSDGEQRMLDKDVRYQLTKNGVETIASIGDLTERALDTGTINGDTTNTYSLRVWMNKDANNDAMGKIFYTSLRIVAEQSSTSTTKSVYYSFGTPTASSATDYKDVITESGSNTFAKLDGNELSVCIYKDSSLECFKNNNATEELSHAKTVFGEANCSDSTCSNSEFSCTIATDGNVACTDKTATHTCTLTATDTVTCS